MSSRDMYARWGEEFPNLQGWRCEDYVCPRSQYLPSRAASPPPDSPYCRAELDAARYTLLSTILTDQDRPARLARPVYGKIGIPSAVHAAVYRHVFDGERYPQYLVHQLDFTRFDVDKDSGLHSDYLAFDDKDDSGNCSGSMIEGSNLGNKQSRTKSKSKNPKSKRDMARATASSKGDLSEDSEDMAIPGYDKSSDEEESKAANNDSDVNKLWYAFKIDGVGKTVTKLRGQSTSSDEDSEESHSNQKKGNKEPIPISSDTDGMDNEKPSTSVLKTKSKAREKRTCSTSSQDEVFEVVHVSEDSTDHEYIVLDSSFADDDDHSDTKKGRNIENGKSESVRVCDDDVVQKLMLLSKAVRKRRQRNKKKKVVRTS